MPHHLHVAIPSAVAGPRVLGVVFACLSILLLRVRGHVCSLKPQTCVWAGMFQVEIFPVLSFSFPPVRLASHQRHLLT